MVKVSDIFYISYGVNLEYYCMEPDARGIRFVSRQAKNNGVVGRVKPLADISPNPANTISVSCGGSVMEAFLQEEPYYSGRDIYLLSPKKSLSKQQMLYFCMVLHLNKYRYNYGRQANKTLASLLIPSLAEIPEWVQKTRIPSNFLLNKLSKYFNVR